MLRHRLLVAAAGAATLTLALTACSGPDRPAGSTSSRAEAPTDLPTGQLAPDGTARDVANGIESPWSVVRIGDNALISERDSARIIELDADGDTRTVANIEGVSHGLESGLLGLALHDRQLYVYSTADSGNRIERYPLQGAAGSYSLGDPTDVITDLPSHSFHDGGRLAFGPDGMLYASVGDAGDGNNAQDRSSLAGKILRVTPTGGIPDDNPFPNSPVWSMGHRNVQGLGWAKDGTMFASEFGENTWDELNVIEPGKNYGWPEVEGEGGTSRGFVDPVQQWRPADASPSGLTVIGDTIFIANLRGERIRTVPVDDLGTSHEYFTSEYGRIRLALAGPDDTLWFITNNTDGIGTPNNGDDQLVQVPLTSGS